MRGKWIHLWGALSATGLVLGCVLAAWGLTANASTSTTRTEFTDKAGRHCTQVGTTALDCDYPPAENRIGDALNGLVNP